MQNVFARPWVLLTRNAIIVVPGIGAGALVGIVIALVTPKYDAAGYAHDPVNFAWLKVYAIGWVTLLGYIVTQAFTVGMAEAAWVRGTARLADGAASFRKDAGRIVVTGAGLLALGTATLYANAFTLALSSLAFVLFTLYAMPAAVIGNRPGFSSIAESFRITSRRFMPTLMVANLIGVAYVAAAVIALSLHAVPVLGRAIAVIVTQFAVVFATLVIVGEYLNLRNLPEETDGRRGTVRTPS
ncbi:MAG: hypothetical protein JWM87_2899 [Candidatus Eremiobacteraeota bacterium]|nr:hypothetical protein [Candidatus Eremiobacteraeota bacterium]